MSVDEIRPVETSSISMVPLGRLHRPERPIRSSQIGLSPSVVSSQKPPGLQPES